MQTNAKQTNEVASQEEPKKKSLFEGLSAAQVIAGALAAVTSMLLSSYIGIAGSIIGTAVGSIVATVASQIYKQALSASADKIRDGIGSISDTVHVRDGAINSALTQKGEATSADEALAESDEEGSISGKHVNGAHSATTVLPSNPLSDDHMNEDQLRARAALERKKRINRRAIVIAIISALVAMLISAAVVNIATSGEGIGTKTEPILTVDDNGVWQFGHHSSGEAQDTAADDTTYNADTTADQNNNQGTATDQTTNSGSTTNNGANSTTPDTSGSSQGDTTNQGGSSTTDGTTENTGDSSTTDQSQNQGSTSSSDQTTTNNR